MTGTRCDHLDRHLEDLGEGRWRCLDCGGAVCGRLKKDHSGDRCIRPPVAGGLTCHRHGSAKGTRGRAKAAERVEEAKVAAELATYLDRHAPIELDVRDVSPEEVLAHDLVMASARRRWFESQLRTTADHVQRDMTGRFERPSVLYELFDRERKHSTEVAKLAMAAGFKEREIRLLEGQGALIVNAMRMLADALELTPAQRERFPDAARQALTAIDATASEVPQAAPGTAQAAS